MGEISRLNLNAAGSGRSHDRRGLSLEVVAKNENGEPFLVPRLVSVLSFAPWKRPRNVATGAHRKSGVVICLSYACPVELYLLPSACLLFTPLQGELQAFSGYPRSHSVPGGNGLSAGLYRLGKNTGPRRLCEPAHARNPRPFASDPDHEALTVKPLLEMRLRMTNALLVFIQMMGVTSSATPSRRALGFRF